MPSTTKRPASFRTADGPHSLNFCTSSGVSCLERVSCVDRPQRSSERLKCVVAFMKYIVSTSLSSTNSFSATNDAPDGSGPTTSTRSGEPDLLWNEKSALASKSRKALARHGLLLHRSYGECLHSMLWIFSHVSILRERSPMHEISVVLKSVFLHPFLSPPPTNPFSPRGKAHSSVKSSVTSNITQVPHPLDSTLGRSLAADD